jgi:hypothetical protein
MNPIGLILIGLGIIFIVIGVKGSQHTVLNSIKGVKGSSSSNSGSTTPRVSTGTPSNPNPVLGPTGAEPL